MYQGRQRKSMAINGWGGNLTPTPSKAPEQMVTKIDMGDNVGDPYPSAECHCDQIGFLLPAPACLCVHKQSDPLVYGAFWRRRTTKPSAPIFTISASNDVSRKDVPFWGHENKILHFDPHLPQKLLILSQFLTALRNLPQKGLNNGSAHV